MKRLIIYWLAIVFFISGLFLIYNTGLADDSCVFMVTADDVPPNIVILLDNGAEMEQICWHDDYDNSVNYPGFFNNPDGYTITKDGCNYNIRNISSDLTEGSVILSSSSNTFTINLTLHDFTVWTRTVTLPWAPSKAVDADGIKDNATRFRYSKNYLNWLFFVYNGDGTDLPDKSRFYYAKQAIFNVAKLTANKAYFGIYNFTSNADGASNVQPLSKVVSDTSTSTLDSNFVNNINNMGTVTYSPLAEGLARVGGYYNSSSSGVVGEYCQNNFVIVVSPGVSSEDQAAASQSLPVSLSDNDGDNATGSIGEGNIKKDESIFTIPTNLNGSTYLDDVAYYLCTNDVVGYQDGTQYVYTYTIGFMGDELSNLFLINTSNNGNENLNLYDTTDPEYGKYHYTAQSPNELSSTLLSAINDIIAERTTFTAPVVPVTRTTSGNRIYLAFFKPSEENLWEGNVAKYGLENNTIVGYSSSDLSGDRIPATYDNGAIKEDVYPYWDTKDWADDSNGTNGILYSNRNIYTYLGSSTNLTDTSNGFTSANLTAALLGNPTTQTTELTDQRDVIINYVRGADVFDEDGNGSTLENRAVITGDILHSEPLIVQYSSSTMVYFGANDGMLHAVNDSNGTEAWAFIPPDQLHRLKEMIEGSGHQYYVDSSPKVYIEDVDGDGVVDSGDKAILVCGERTGGTGYFALDVTDPSAPKFLWRINQVDDSTLGIPAPDHTYSELGKSWSEPQFGLVKTSDTDTTGTPVLFIGGGYSSDNSVGKAVLAINVLTGAEVKKWTTGMGYSFASSVRVIDENNNDFVDKFYVGDLGGQMWRFGKFTDSVGNPLPFFNSDENITNWTGEIIFDSTNARKFFYPPGVALEKGYDLVFMGTGDRENPCNSISSNRIYVVKDEHGSSTINESDLVDVTDTTTTAPDLDNLTGSHKGWYIRLAEGEKALAEGTIFYKTFYITTFLPNNDICVPGGYGYFYALNYKTGGAVLNFDDDENDKERSINIGGGIPSKPVMVITEKGQKLFSSVGSTNPDDAESFDAGIVAIDPLAPPINFFYLWWKELFD